MSRKKQYGIIVPHDYLLLALFNILETSAFCDASWSDFSDAASCLYSVTNCNNSLPPGN